MLARRLRLFIGFTALSVALSGCAGAALPAIPIPPTPSPDPLSMVVAQSHQHGSSGVGGRLITRYGGPLSVLLATEPPAPLPGSPLTMTYTLKGSDARPVPPNELSVTHERIMHTVLVSQDLRHFSHIHPTPKGEGRYSVTDTLPYQGKYVLFNEFFTAAGAMQLERNVFATDGAGEADDPALLEPTLGQPQQVGSLTALLRANTQKVRRRAPATFTLSVSKDGEPVTDMGPYLGAPCHVVIISADTRQFEHTHGDVLGRPMSGDMSGMPMGSMTMPTPPSSFGPDLQFTYTFMQPGMYRLWVQFVYRGKVVTVPNNVRVEK